MEYSRCVIITAYNESPVREIVEIADTDFIVCADGGLAQAERENIEANLVIGDFDSMLFADFKGNAEHFPVEKDDTDTMLCIKKAIALGFQKIVIAGGVGGRLDHTIANLQSVAFAVKAGVSCKMVSKNTIASVFLPGEYVLKRRKGFVFSLFAMGDVATGVDIEHAKYPLCNATVENSFPIGVSNEFTDGDAVVRFRTGLLLCLVCRNDKR